MQTKSCLGPQGSEPGFWTIKTSKDSDQSIPYGYCCLEILTLKFSSNEAEIDSKRVDQDIHAQECKYLT